jgi:hypothetical protein
MGNITGKDVGDFQAGVGKVNSQIGVIGSYIGAFIFILIGIAMVIYALIPIKPVGCTVDTEKMTVEAECIEPNSQDCKDALEALSKKKTLCDTKKRNYWFLLGILFIPLAIFIVWYAKWWNHLTHTNRNAAQLGGFMAEGNILSNIFHH